MNIILEKIKQIAVNTPDKQAVLVHHDKDSERVEVNVNLADNSFSYAQLQSLIELVSVELTLLSAKRVALYMPNSYSWIVTDLAAANIGLTIVPIPLFFSKQQIKHLLSDANIDVVVMPNTTTNTTSNNINTLLAQSKAVKHSEVLATQYIVLKSNEQSDNPHLDLSNVSKITYTSGSTGTPKGVCLTDKVITQVVTSVAMQLADSGITRHLSLLPYATLLENIAGIYMPLYMGNTVITGDTSAMGLMSNHQFCASKFIAASQRLQANSVILLPQMLKAIAEQNQAEKLSSLTFMAVGGGKVSAQLIEQCREQHLPVYEGYGLSECASVVSLNTPKAHKVGSVGKPLPHVEIIINDSGELIVGGNNMQGYLGESHVKESIETGDIAHLDDDGYLFITGRKKNLIISSFGRNISPEWVESQFLVAPQIKQIAVFGEAQPYLSAIIVAQQHTTRTELLAVIYRINNTLPDYARVQRWHLSREDFGVENTQLTENGKLCRNVIGTAYQQFLTTVEAVA